MKYLSFLFLSLALCSHVVHSFSGDLTWYHPSAGISACGNRHSDEELVAALSFSDFINTPNPNNSPSCGRCIRITSSAGKSVKVRVTDKCGGCKPGDIDVSPAAFRHIAPLSVGRLPVEWKYVSCGRGSRRVPVDVSPPRTVAPPIRSSTRATTMSSRSGSVRGYYSWTWKGSSGINSATMSVAFSGWTDVTNAIQESKKVDNTLKGDKYISFGGGNANGRMSAAGLSNINSAIKDGRLRGYAGIVYDVEEGDSGLAQAFTESFRTAKSNGFKVIVTVSHSQPYGISDAGQLMSTFLKSEYVDYLSPQLYTSGTEASNDYAITNGYVWENYRGSRPGIVVSIVRASLFEDAKKFFANKGVTVVGFIQWEQ